jgi:decaprenyl-phosphate phosphoribosyltransferase
MAKGIARPSSRGLIGGGRMKPMRLGQTEDRVLDLNLGAKEELFGWSSELAPDRLSKYKGVAQEALRTNAAAETLGRQATAVPFRKRLLAHLAITRPDHSIKNLFVLPGIIVPLSVYPALFSLRLLWPLFLAFVSVTLIACSNYVINEVLDAPFDRLHPTKRNRPAACGLVNTGAAYAQWVLMMIAGIAIGLLVSRMFALACLVLWFMGCLYNIPPIRTKDVAYLDVLTESINNPLRMLIGWYAVTSTLVPPLSLLVAYWMIGCYFMALKRFSELSEINNREVAGAYRASFKHYTTVSLLVSALFYSSAAMLFLGAFIIRYRIELIIGFPLIALTMAIYLRLSFDSESAVQNPEKLYQEPMLMAAFTTTALAMCLLLFIRIPQLEKFFMPTLPPMPTHFASPATVSAPREGDDSSAQASVAMRRLQLSPGGLC